MESDDPNSVALEVVVFDAALREMIDRELLLEIAENSWLRWKEIWNSDQKVVAPPWWINTNGGKEQVTSTQEGQVSDTESLEDDDMMPFDLFSPNHFTRHDDEFSEQRDRILKWWRGWFLRVISSPVRTESGHEDELRQRMMRLLIESWMDWLHFRWFPDAMAASVACHIVRTLPSQTAWRFEYLGTPLIEDRMVLVQQLREEMVLVHQHALEAERYDLAVRLGEFLATKAPAMFPASRPPSALPVEAGIRESLSVRQGILETMHQCFNVPLGPQHLLQVAAYQLTYLCPEEAVSWIPRLMSLNNWQLLSQLLPPPRSVHTCRSSFLSQHTASGHLILRRAASWQEHYSNLSVFHQAIVDWFWRTIFRRHLTLIIPHLWLNPLSEGQDNQAQRIFREWWRQCSAELGCLSGCLRNLPVSPANSRRSFSERKRRAIQNSPPSSPSAPSSLRRSISSTDLLA